MLAFNVSYSAWAVVVDGKIASHHPISAAVFDDRDEALAFRDELQPHLTSKCRVQKVVMAFQEVPAKRKAVSGG